MYLVSFRTCRFGPGVDEGSGTAAPHLLVAGMKVNTVDSEGLQVVDLQSFSCAPVLRERVLLDRRNTICAVIPLTEAGVSPTITKQRVVGHTENISTPTIWRSAIQKDKQMQQL